MTQYELITNNTIGVTIGDSPFGGPPRRTQICWILLHLFRHINWIRTINIISKYMVVSTLKVLHLLTACHCYFLHDNIQIGGTQSQ